MMKQYLRLNDENEVVGIFELPEDEVPECGEDTVVENPTPFPKGWPSGPTQTSVLKFIDNEIAWVEVATLASVIAKAVAEVDLFADKCRLAVVGDAARIKEYERAQLHAEEYKAADWTMETVPSSVNSWATAKGWTPRQAAEDILAASARWYGALDGIRALRLKTKEDIKAADTIAEALALLNTFKITLTAAMTGVQ